MPRNVADLLVECLINEGVDTIFGLPGEENADFAQALKKRAGEIRFVLARHEQGAAFAADCYARLNGRPGVVFATLGPGATNLITGVADANMDRAPMVVITGQASTNRLHKESHQAVDVRGLFAPITKWGATIVNEQTVPEIARKAFKVALLEKPGATHIELPEDVAAREVPDDLVPLARIDKVRRSVPDDKAVDKIFEMLRESKRPVILAGNGALRHHATRQLELFCEATGVPVVNTFMGKGAVARERDYCLFTVGLSSGDHNNVVLEQSDLVISVGFDIVEYHPRLWNPRKDLRIAHIDFQPAEVDAFYRCEAEAIGDLSHTLWMLNERNAAAPYRVASDEYYAKTRRTMLDDFAMHKDDAGDGPVRPQKVLWDLRQALGPDDVVLSDVGAHKMWIARYYQASSPNTVVIGNGWCSMGIALPGALGARLAFPDRNVVAVCGDGGFLMNVQTMQVIADEGAKVVCIVFVDGKYGLIEWKQETHYGAGEASPLAFGNPDFAALAKAFHWNHRHVAKPGEMAPALDAALADKRSVLISVDIDYRENALLTKRLGSLRRTE